MPRLVIPGAIALMASACLPLAADGRLEIKGRVSDDNRKLFEKCRLELFSTGGPRVVYREIAGEFTFSSTGPPGRSSYVVEISCEGARTRYHSDPVEIGGKMPTDLGQIVLERR